MKHKTTILFLLSIFFMHCHAANEFLKQFISPGDLVFDVGANIGKKAIEYLELGATVVCFEPQPNCTATLRSRFKNNPHLFVEEKGLADKPGILTLAVCRSSDTISTFSEEWRAPNGRFARFGARWNKRIEVEVVTLDAMIAQYGCPRFCKIDVENFEYEVLSGLNQPIPALSFEFAIEVLHNTKKCVERLVHLGYTRFNFAVAEEQRFALSDWVDAASVIKAIEDMSHKHHLLWGDVYAKFD